MSDFAYTDYESRHNEVERRREREARFLPQEFQMWEYFTPEGVTMPAPICVRCQLEMRCEKNGRLVNDVRAANFPATYWLGDLFRCAQCDTQIVVGFGREMVELHVARLRDNGVVSGASMVFAHESHQLQKYADQFKRSEATDA